MRRVIVAVVIAAAAASMLPALADEFGEAHNNDAGNGVDYSGQRTQAPTDARPANRGGRGTTPVFVALVPALSAASGGGFCISTRPRTFPDQASAAAAH